MDGRQVAVCMQQSCKRNVKEKSKLYKNALTDLVRQAEPRRAPLVVGIGRHQVFGAEPEPLAVARHADPASR